jgi:peptide/nickel transport system permease protein
MKVLVHLRVVVRTLLLVLLVTTGSLILVRFAPGYLSDAREMDSRYARSAQRELAERAAQDASLIGMLRDNMGSWFHGDLGRSRQFDIPVRKLITPRVGVTGALIGRSILLAWVIALGSGCLANAFRIPSMVFQIPTMLLLAIPASALATLSLLTDTGGPILVLTLLIAARDFKFVDRILRGAWRAPHVLQARAQGVKPWPVFRDHILPNVAANLLALSRLSIVMALTALVPVEVQFNVPGLGHLAWNAALNRDMPVLVAVSVIMALAFTATGLVTDRERDLTTA